MRDSFGARLRRHREDRGVSLAEVAEQTKIKASLLDGLERDDISQWPAGIFRRAYVRAYAAAIGFDPEAAIREFLALHPDPIETAEPAVPASSGLRGLFGTFRRRTSAPIAPPSQTSHGVTATVGKRPAEPLASGPPVADAAPLPSETPAAAQPEPIAPAMPQPPVMAAEPQEPTTPDTPRAVENKPTPSSDLLLAAAKVCTELGRVEEIGQVPPLLAEAAKVLGARGLIVWVWDGIAGELEPALVHGYPAKVRARLRGVQANADNVTAAAYRAGAPLARSGALAVPMLMPSGCAGVLAIEVDKGREQDAEVRAFTSFFAAMLAQLVGAPANETAVSSPESPHESIIPQAAAAARPS